jgi:putative ABC transport system substrate-binding protein
VLGDPLTYSLRPEIADLSAKFRLPAVYPSREWVEAGGLMSYGADRRQMYRRAAEYVDKILKGAKPGDLPVEQPTNFELVINLQDREGPRPHDPTVTPAAGGSGD